VDCGSGNVRALRRCNARRGIKPRHYAAAFQVLVAAISRAKSAKSLGSRPRARCTPVKRHQELTRVRCCARCYNLSSRDGDASAGRFGADSGSQAETDLRLNSSRPTCGPSQRAAGAAGSALASAGSMAASQFDRGLLNLAMVRLILEPNPGPATVEPPSSCRSQRHRTMMQSPIGQGHQRDKPSSRP